MKVGYIVPVRNEEDSLPDFLESLTAAIDSPGAERQFVFVINGCEDQSEKLLRSFCTGCSLASVVQLKGKPGILRAFRHGIHWLRPRDYYGKIDADICLETRSLQDLEQVLNDCPEVRAAFCEPVPFSGSRDYLDAACGHAVSYGERKYLEGRASLYRGDPFDGVDQDQRLDSLRCEDIFLSAFLYARYGTNALKQSGTIHFRPPATRSDYARMLKRTTDELAIIREHFPELRKALQELDRPILDPDAVDLTREIAAEIVPPELDWPRLPSTKGGRCLDDPTRSFWRVSRDE